MEAERFVSRRLEIGLAVHPLIVISQPETRAGEGRESVEAFAADPLSRELAEIAADLDAQTAKLRKLETANRDIAQRLDAAMENIRLVLESQD